MTKSFRGCERRRNGFMPFWFASWDRFELYEKQSCDLQKAIVRQLELSLSRLLKLVFPMVRTNISSYGERN